MTIKIEEFKGRPTLSIWTSDKDRFPKFACQQEKAKVIVQHFEVLKYFAEHGCLPTEGNGKKSKK